MGVWARVEPLLQVLARAVRRGGVFLVGMTLLVAGAAMLVLPGPGIAVILLGLVVLSAEFQWAKRALAWVRERASDLKDQAQSLAVSRTRMGSRPVVPEVVCQRIAASRPATGSSPNGGRSPWEAIHSSRVSMGSRRRSSRVRSCSGSNPACLKDRW
jgi:uncharacterized protein (TIGR02611 family)